MAALNGLFGPPCCVVLFLTLAPGNTWREVLIRLAGCAVGTKSVGELYFRVGTGNGRVVH